MAQSGNGSGNVCGLLQFALIPVAVESAADSRPGTGPQLSDASIFFIICTLLDSQSLALVSRVCKPLHQPSLNEKLWKPRCMTLWPELKHATQLEKDPFPIYKSCFGRKIAENGTSMNDLMKEFKYCDWYACPNGHLYVIGECRIPIQVARCPECGERIGGRYHRMLDTNSHLGAVQRSYQPLRNRNMNESEVEFSQITNVINHSRNGSGDTRHRWENNGMKTIEETEVDRFNAMTRADNSGNEPPPYLICPLSMEIYDEPVVTPDGTVYDKSQILEWLKEHNTDPMNPNLNLSVDDLKPEPDIARAVATWKLGHRLRQRRKKE